jgi:hypothetical protein
MTKLTQLSFTADCENIKVTQAYYYVGIDAAGKV